MIQSTGTTAHTLVLIDTWWNVNTAVTYSDGYFGKVLIDTWWNVNFFIPPFHLLL